MPSLTTNPALPGVAIAMTDEWIKRVIDPQALKAVDGKPLDNAPSASMRGSVSVIPVKGPLSKEPSIWSWVFGGSNYESIARDIRQSLESAEVKTIVLDVDSPGGVVDGCDELSAMIAEANKRKPVIAYIGGMGASAAYWLAASAGRIVANPTAQLGSIGTKTTLVDQTRALDTAGVALYEIESSQSPLKNIDPASEADRLRVKAMLSDLASVFIERVATGRRVSTAKVEQDFGRGDVFIGAKAKKANLADSLGDFETLIAQLTAPPPSASVMTVRANNNPNRGKGMSMKNAKCSSCASDFDDDDDTYCASCKGSKASGLDAQILALTGKENPVEAMGVLSAWKNVASEMVEIRAKAAESEKAAAEMAFDAEIATAKNMRLLAVSDDHKRNKAALAFKGSADAIKGLKSFLSALDPLSAPSAEESAKEKKAEAPEAPVAHGFSDKHMKAFSEISKKTGSAFTPEQLAAHRALLAKTINPSEEN